MKNILYLLVFLIPFAVTAQQAPAPRDTSFAVYSTYVKTKKQYPDIAIAKPGLPEGVVAQWDVPYKKITGRELRMDVFYPAKKSRKGYPGVLLIHGGGWSSGDKSHQVPLAQQLAAKGYVAVAVEYRLSPEATYPAAVHDLKDAVRWMRSNAKAFQLDASKIATLGCSAGGQLATLVGATNGMAQFEGDMGKSKASSAVQAVVNIDGTLSFVHPESREGKATVSWLGGTYEAIPETWKEASPLTHAAQNSVPVLFINSSQPRFHAGRDDMLKALAVNNIYTEVHTLPDTPHPFWLFHPWLEPTVKFTVDFLDKVFKNKQ